MDINRHWGIYLKHLLLVFFFLCGMLACTHSKNKEVRRIAILHSLSEDELFYPDFNRNIREQLEDNDVNAEYRYFYLDCESHIASEEIAKTNTYLDSLQKWKPDLILANQDQILYNLLLSSHPLVRQIPIVFSGINFPNWSLLNQYPNVTGFIDIPDYAENVRLIEKMLGKVRIIVNYDETKLGQGAHALFVEGVKRCNVLFNYNRLSSVFPEKFAAAYDPKFSAEMLSSHMACPDTVMIDFIPFRRILGMDVFGELNGMKKFYTYLNIKHDYMTVPLGRYFEVPTFTAIMEGFGFTNAYVGGYMSSYETFAQDQARVAAEILNNGVKPLDIPIKNSKKEYIFDWDEMQRFKITPKDLPNGSRIIDMPFAEQHRIRFLVLEILGGILILGIISYLLFLYFREASHKRMALLRLKQEREALGMAIEGGNMFVWKYVNNNFVFDPDFFISLNMESQVFTRQEFVRLVYPEDRKNILKRINRFQDRNVERRSIQIRCNFNGEGYQWWEFRYGQMNPGTEDGTFLINGLCLNIQKRKDIETSLIAAKKKAEESDQMKSAFLANMSHEIRTPLNAIVGFSNLITSGEMELTQEEKNEFLILINTNCDLLLKLINDILDLSRIESGRMDFVFESCNLTELIINVFRTHQLLMPADVELKKETPEDPVYLLTDKHRLTQVLTNFINNAAKFTKAGYIKIGYYLDTNSVHIYVEDTGIGIPKEKQKKVFERFNKLNEFAQGTGLGLAICKVIVQRFNGNILLRSVEGKGSCFTIVIPLSKNKLHSESRSVDK